MSNQKSGSRTLLMSVLMSAPGPLILGLNLITGNSSTQLADFYRRSAELLALICSYVVYKLVRCGGKEDAKRKARLERIANLFVGAVMCISGIIMIALAIFAKSEDKGNVIPGLVIAALGLIANTLFWRKYTRLNQQSPDAILAVQSRLYRAKALVDACVTIALAAVVLFPVSYWAAMLDTVGSIIVASYLIWCGIRTIKDIFDKNDYVI